MASTTATAATLRRARRLFTRALETPGGLKIQTIHAFCERVLQLFPVEAGVVPHFAMLDEREPARSPAVAARGEVLDEALKQPADDLGLARLPMSCGGCSPMASISS